MKSRPGTKLIRYVFEPCPCSLAAHIARSAEPSTNGSPKTLGCARALLRSEFSLRHILTHLRGVPRAVPMLSSRVRSGEGWRTCEVLHLQPFHWRVERSIR